jgi:hypothetical protein
VVWQGGEEGEEEDESVESLMARLGYEYEDPRLGKIREREERRAMARAGITPPGPTPEEMKRKKKALSGEGDAYEDYYSTEVREKVGWEVLKQRQQQQQTHTQTQTQTHNDDPYADYAKLREDAEKTAIIKEARRVNREGLVGYGLGEDKVGQEVASKFNVPSAGLSGEWDAFEQAAKQGVQDLGMYDVDYLRGPGFGRSSGSGSGINGGGGGPQQEAEGGQGIEDLMASLGYEYEDPRVSKRQGQEAQQRLVTSPTSTTTTATRPPPPPPQPTTTQQNPPPTPTTTSQPTSTTTPAPLPPPTSRPPPPWSPQIESLYARVKANQAAARKRQNLPPPSTPDEEVIVPFKNKAVDMPRDNQGNLRQLTMEEVMEKIEVMRVNPDGSFTKVEFGQGLPPAWVPPPQPSAVDTVPGAGGKFETLPRPPTYTQTQAQVAGGGGKQQ